MATANIKAEITAEDHASKALHGFAASVGHMGDIIANSMKGAALAFTAAGTAAIGFAVKSAAEFEQTRIGLENMLGSAAGAKSLLKDISDFAARTPFEFPELAQATRQLVAFGFSASDAFDTMKQLGDVSAAVGAPINDLAYLMGTLRTQGRAFTVDIRQFAQRGIPIYEYLAKVLKTNEQEISKMIEAGKIGFPEVQKAFQMMTAEGGKFHNTMEKQSKSLSGLFSTLKDTLSSAGREIVGINKEGDIRAGSLMEKMKTGLTELTSTVEKSVPDIKQFFADLTLTLEKLVNKFRDVANQVADYLTPKLQTLWKTIQDDLMPVLNRLWKEVLEPLAPIFGAVLVGGIGLAIDAINLLITTFSGLMNWILDHQTLFVPIITAVGTFWTMLQARAAFDAFVGMMTVLRTVTISQLIGSFGTLGATLTGFTGWGIFAAMAVGAFVTIQQKAAETKRTLDTTFQNIKDSSDSTLDAIRRLGELMRTGTPEQKKRAQEALQRVRGYATGTDFFPGGVGMFGERGPELAVAPKGTKVIPADKTQRMLGGGTTVNLNVNVGMFAGTPMERRQIAKMMFKDFKDVAAQMGVPATDLLGTNNGLVIR